MEPVLPSEAQRRYDSAMSQIRKGLTFKNGAPAAESKAANAYEEMVRGGEVAPIKRKYRTGKFLKKVRS